MSDWMKKSTIGDVQTAIQSQTIQTALERNLSDLSPQALQSFLTQAPIPRVSAGTLATGVGAVAAAVATWTVDTLYIDPYNMLVPATGFITLPIDGYYAFHFSVAGTAGAASTFRLYWDIAGRLYSINVVPPVAGTAVYECSTSLVYPFRAGTVAKPTMLNDSAAILSGFTGSVGVVWQSPFNAYQGGQN